MTITSKDLSKAGGLTGVARREAEKAKINEELLAKAIAHIESEKLKKMNKINAHKLVFSILKEEMKNKIHALEIEIK